MVRINSAVLAGLAAVGVSARPATGNSKRADSCMTPEQAQGVATNFGTLIAHYSDELANNALAVNFTDYSESVNTLINTCPQGSAAISLPLLAPTFSSRAQFERGQAQQPPINFEQLAIFPGCQSVVIRWMTNNTAPIPEPKPVVGIIAMEVVANDNATAAVDYPWLIDYVYSEFDSGAWLQNLQEAGICGTPPANSSAIPDPSASSSASASASSSTSAAAAANTCACSGVNLSLGLNLAGATSTSAPTSTSSSAAAVADSKNSAPTTSFTSDAYVATATSVVTVLVDAQGNVIEDCDQ